MSNEERQEAEDFRKFLESITRDLEVTNEDGSKTAIKCSDTFSYKVPKGHADEGKEYEKAFSYPICETNDDVEKVLEGKGWSVLQMVNDALKANARSNAYQLALAAYKTTRTPEQLREDIIRDMVRGGINPEVARKQVEALFAAQ